MSEMTALVVVAMVAGFFVGVFTSELRNSSYLRLKAEPKHRSAMKLGDAFFYIVPEKEYVDTGIAALSAKQTRQALAFARSLILSGEPYTGRARDVIDGALGLQPRDGPASRVM